MTISPVSGLQAATIIVDPTAGKGNYTTIQAAITAASSGTTILIKPGTYTENLTLKAGVNLTAFPCDSVYAFAGFTHNVNIIGKMTATYTGYVSLSCLGLQTNSDYIIESTGSNSAVLFVEDCDFNCTNFSALHNTNNNFGSQFTDCTWDLGTTGIACFVYTGGTIYFSKSVITNSGGSTTASTASGGTVLTISYTSTQNPITTSGSCQFSAIYSQWSTGNTTSLTIGGSLGLVLEKSIVSAGSASAISISSAANIYDCEISSSNTNAITGAGSISYGGLTFLSSSSINVTTQSIIFEGPSRTIGSANSGGTNTFTLTNTSNTASSNANEILSVGGGSAGDPFTTYTVTGSSSWSAGIDTSDPYYKISNSTALGTTDVIKLTSSGATIIGDTNHTFTTRNSASFINLNVTNTDTVTGTSGSAISINNGGTSSGNIWYGLSKGSARSWAIGMPPTSSEQLVIHTTNAAGVAPDTGTEVWKMSTAGERTMALQPAFLAYLDTAVLNVTGDGTQYTIIFDTEVFDQNADFNLGTSTFTAPVTGRYQINFSLSLIGGTIMSAIIGRLVTSNRTYRMTLPLNAGVTTAASAAGSILADMDAADTFTITITSTDTGGKVDDVAGTTGGEVRNWISAQLAC